MKNEVRVPGIIQGKKRMYLNCKTYYSFRYGTYSTNELITAAVEKGISLLALTNINCIVDAWQFIKLCEQNNIKPITGIGIRNDDELLYILIAANNKGFAFATKKNQ